MYSLLRRLGDPHGPSGPFGLPLQSMAVRVGHKIKEVVFSHVCCAAVRDASAYLLTYLLTYSMEQSPS